MYFTNMENNENYLSNCLEVLKIPIPSLTPNLCKNSIWSIFEK